MTEDELIKEIIDEFFNKIIYGAMVNNMETGIKAKLNYPVALSLCAYTEHLGGLITGNFGVRGHSPNNFITFLKEMGKDYSKDEKQMLDIYDKVRCGLVHEYFIKPTTPNGAIGMVSISLSPIFSDDPTIYPGIFIDRNGKIFFSVENYLRDFKKAVKKYYKRLVENKEEELIKNFLKGTKYVINI